MKFLVGIVALVASLVASAQTRIVSIDAFDLSYTGGLIFKHDEAKSKSVSDRDETTFRLNLNYAQNTEQYIGLMWKGEFHWNREDVDYGGDTLESSFGVSGGLLYNFLADDIKNSIFAGLQGGIERMTIDDSTKDESGFNLYVKGEAGKRWDLGHYSAANITYAPTVALTLKRYGGDIRDNFFKSGNEIKLNFLKFDILF
jgi:hypothetical protein